METTRVFQLVYNSTSRPTEIQVNIPFLVKKVAFGSVAGLNVGLIVPEAPCTASLIVTPMTSSMVDDQPIALVSYVDAQVPTAISTPLVYTFQHPRDINGTYRINFPTTTYKGTVTIIARFIE